MLKSVNFEESQSNTIAPPTRIKMETIVLVAPNAAPATPKLRYMGVILL